MNTGSILDFASKALGMVPGLLSAGVSIANVVHFAKDSATKVSDMQANDRAPTQQEWDALDQQEATLRSQLHAGEQKS